MSDIFGDFMKRNQENPNPASDTDSEGGEKTSQSPAAKGQTAGSRGTKAPTDVYLDYVTGYETAFGQQDELAAQVLDCDNKREQCLRNEQQVEARVMADAENVKRNYQNSVFQIEADLNQQTQANKRALDDNYEQEKKLKNQQKFYQDTFYEEPVYNEAIQDKLTQLYKEKDMTSGQRAYMTMDPEAVCESKIRTGNDLVSQEQYFSNTDVCKKIMDPAMADYAVRDDRYKKIRDYYPFAYLVLSILTLFLGYFISPIFGVVFAVGAGLAIGDVFYLLISRHTDCTDRVSIMISAGIAIALAVIASAVVIASGFWIFNLALLIPQIILLLVCTYGSSDFVARVTRAMQRFSKNPSYPGALADVDGNENINREMYCYLYHDDILDYLNGPVREGHLKNINANLQQLMDQRNELLKEKDSLSQRADELVHMKEQADSKTSEINASLQADFSTEGDISSESTQNSELRDARQQYETANANLQAAAEKMQENKRILEQYNDVLIHWDKPPVLNNSDPAFQKEMAVRQGPEGEDRIFILRHDLEWVNIEYDADPEEDICTVLADLIWWLEKALENINAPELLQIFIIDEESEGQALLIDNRFLSKINLIKDVGAGKSGCYVCGKDVRSLQSYLDKQWDEIIAFRQKYSDLMRQADASGHPNDFPIYSANKAITDPMGSINRQPYPYKVLFIMVPHKTEGYDRNNMNDFLKKIDGPFCQSGIIPFFFSNTNSMSDSYRKYVEKCTRCFEADLTANKLKEAGGK